MMNYKPTISEVFPLVLKYYSISGNECGGSLHVILEDNNIDDCHVRYCQKYATERNDILGIELAEKLLFMSKTQRKKLSSMRKQRDYGERGSVK